jgi:type I restriction enzyme M protein
MARKVSYLPLEGRVVAEPEEGWIERGRRKELINILVDGSRVIYRCGHRGGTFSDNYQDPEEKVRAEFFVELVERYQYPPERIDFEVEVPRREPKDKADVVIYRDDAQKTAYCVVECKPDGISEAEIEQAVKQAGGNANNLRASYAMMVAGNVRIVFDAKQWDPKRPLDSGIIADLPVRYGQAPKYRYWKQREGWPDLAVVNESQLRDAFQQCHDILWEGGRRNPAEAFDEMSKLMFCKLQDERVHTGIGESYAFQCGTNETVDEVMDKVKVIYKEAQETAPTVFQRPIEAEPHLVYRVVQVLQGISMDRMDLDVKGAAFEKFLGVVFRGEMGQYFTHRNLVNSMVDMLEPNRRDKVIDPACGSGGFLLQALDQVRRQVEARLEPAHALQDWRDWALRRLHGIEINEQISRVAMMGMIIHEDGHTNIKCTDALQVFEDINSLRDNITVEPDTYTLLMTNPPFGAKVTRVRKGAKHPYLDTYELGGKERRRNSQNTEILFIERCLQLLAPGGRMGIVLPDGILTNSSLQYVRDFVMREARVLAVVSLPQHTFVPAGAGVKASLLFLRKWRKGEDWEQDYPIFMAMAEHVGYTATGKDDDNDLPAIVEAYRQFRWDHADFF